jgi:hypothetical protein
MLEFPSEGLPIPRRFVGKAQAPRGSVPEPSEPQSPDYREPRLGLNSPRDAQNRRSTKNATKNARMKLVIRRTPRRENRCSTRVLPVGLAGFEPATS